MKLKKWNCNVTHVYKRDPHVVAVYVAKETKTRNNSSPVFFNNNIYFLILQPCMTFYYDHDVTHVSNVLSPLFIVFFSLE